MDTTTDPTQQPAREEAETGLPASSREPCRHCGQPNIPSPEEIAKLAAALSIPEGDRCGRTDYERRLSACSACPDLQGGATCAHCGCFSAIRAIYRDKTCPHPAGNRW